MWTAVIRHSHVAIYNIKFLFFDFHKPLIISSEKKPTIFCHLWIIKRCDFHHRKVYFLLKGLISVIVTNTCSENVWNPSIYRTSTSKLCHVIFEPENTKDPSKMSLSFTREWTVYVPVTSVITRKLIYLLHHKDSYVIEYKITEQLTFRCWMFWRAEDNVGRHCEEMVESVFLRYKWTSWFLLQWMI